MNCAWRRNNITEPGEGEAAAALRKSWTRYQQALDEFLAATTLEAWDRFVLRSPVACFCRDEDRLPIGFST